MNRVGSYVEREAARVNAHWKPSEDGSRRWVEHGHRPPSAQRYVQSAAAILDEAPRLVPAHEGDGRHDGHRIEIDDDDLIVIGVGDGRPVPLADDGERAPRDGGRRIFRFYDCLGIDAGFGGASGGTCASPLAGGTTGPARR
jgi:hypothetical protein